MGRNVHPGFKAAAGSAAKRQGISIEGAAAEVAVGVWLVGASARKASRRLNRVRGR